MSKYILSIYPKSLMNLKQDKHEVNYIKAHDSQIAEDQ